MHIIQDMPWFCYLAILPALSKAVVPPKKFGAIPLDVRKCGGLSRRGRDIAAT
jgi:hypothetical protein